MSSLHHICIKAVECMDEVKKKKQKKSIVAWLSNEAIVVCGVIQGLWLFSPGTDGPE